MIHIPGKVSTLKFSCKKVFLSRKPFYFIKQRNLGGLWEKKKRFIQKVSSLNCSHKINDFFFRYYLRGGVVCKTQKTICFVHGNHFFVLTAKNILRRGEVSHKTTQNSWRLLMKKMKVGVNKWVFSRSIWRKKMRF